MNRLLVFRDSLISATFIAAIGDNVRGVFDGTFYISFTIWD